MPINMQGWEWVILIVLALLIFGGTRLAGAGKNAGRALREFKDETRQIKADDERAKREEDLRRREEELDRREAGAEPVEPAELRRGEVVEEVHDAEVVETEKPDRA